MTIGVIAAAHGVGGAVRLRPLTDVPRRFDGLKQVHVLHDGARTERRIEWVRDHVRGTLILKLEDVTTRSDAEAMRGAELQVPREETAPLPPGTFYVFELVGSTVVGLDGAALGEVVDVLTTTANDVYVVRGDDGRELLIPALKRVVIEVDAEAGRIVVDPPPGLFD